MQRVVASLRRRQGECGCLNVLQDWRVLSATVLEEQHPCQRIEPLQRPDLRGQPQLGNRIIQMQTPHAALSCGGLFRGDLAATQEICRVTAAVAKLHRQRRRLPLRRREPGREGTLRSGLSGEPTCEQQAHAKDQGNPVPYPNRKAGAEVLSCAIGPPRL